MRDLDVERLLEESGAILRGHFVLTSGRHSDVYFEKFRLLERPDVLSRMCETLAAFGKQVGATLVAGPTTGGILVAMETARQMGVPALYVETENGAKTLRRGAVVPEGSRVLVVDDVLTTGLSVREVVELLRNRGAEVVGVGVLISRAEQTLEFGAPLRAVHTVEARSFAADAVPDWLAAIPVVKPGTRREPSNPIIDQVEARS